MLAPSAHSDTGGITSPSITYITPPDHKRVERHFTPPDNPSYSEIIAFAHSEQKRWGGPSIIGRIACESSFNPKVVNSGGYAGLLQVGSIWGYLWGGTPRDVKLVTHKTVRLPVQKVTADPVTGGIVYEDVDTKRVDVKLVRTGKLPKNAGPTHGFAAIRVGQRAVSPRGYPTTGWACGL